MMRRGSFRANVLRWEDIDPYDGFPSSDPSNHDHLILAEGDSWFSIGGFPPTNLLYALRFRRMTMVVSCASPGDTIVNMSDIAENTRFKEALAQNDYVWDAILLSGGGNDLIDNVASILLSPDERTLPPSPEASDYCDVEKLNALMATIQAGYRSLAARRDATAGPIKDCPIVTHTYDHATPRNEPARFIGFRLKGPWLYKAFTEALVPTADWMKVSRFLSDRLAEALIELEVGSDPIRHFNVVDTRGLLTPPALDAIGPTTHWLNEIHPNHDGYSEIATKIEKTKLYGLVYG